MIACVCLSYFAASVERRATPMLASRPLVLGGQPWADDPLYGFSQEVAWQGVRPGMALRQAHLLFPTATFMDATPPQYAAASAEIHDCLTDFAGRVEPRAWWQGANSDPTASPALGRRLPAVYWLDIGSLPQREIIPLAQHMGRTVRQATRLEASIGLAEHSWTAQVAAALSRPGHLLPVAAGNEKAFLAGRSLQFLPLEAKLRRQLLQLGIQTLGQLTALPLSTLQDRFGLAIVPLYRLAEGEDTTRIPLNPVEDTLTVNRLFPDSLDNLLSLRAVVADMTGVLAAQLRAKSQMAQLIRVRWETVEGGQKEKEWALRQPVGDETHLRQTVLELLAPSQLPAPLARLTVELTQLVPAQVEQLTLFAPVAATRPVSPLVLLTRYAQHTLQAQLVAPDHPLPGQRFVWYTPSL
jgi:DNA polymerase-4